MKALFQKIRRLLGQDSQAGEKIKQAEANGRSASPAKPAEPIQDASPVPHNRIPSPLPPQRRKGRIRSYAEEEANHDRWVELLSPWTLTCAARELAPWPRPRRRWKLFRERERPPTAYEIWRVERHAALVRRLEKLGYLER